MFKVWDHKLGGAELCAADTYDSAVEWCKTMNHLPENVTITDPEGNVVHEPSPTWDLDAEPPVL